MSSWKWEREAAAEPEDGARSRRKSARYHSGVYAEPDDAIQQQQREEEDDTVDHSAHSRPRNGRPNKNTTRTCPNCQEHVKAGSTACDYCDYVFSSPHQEEETLPIAYRFPFQIEREDDGTKKIETILGRRRLPPGTSTVAYHKGVYHCSPTAAASAASKGGQRVLHRHVLAAKDHKREKCSYEYLVKYKGASYLKAEWLTVPQMDAMGRGSKQNLGRWLKRREKGEQDELEDSTFDHSYCVVDKILDHVDPEVELSDDEADVAKPTYLQHELNTLSTEQSDAVEGNSKLIYPYIDSTPSGRGWFQMTRCRFVFNKITEDEYSYWFYEPVDTSLYTDYLQIVRHPMSLSVIRRKLEVPNAYHNDPALFAHDMRLIWSNCEEYNGQTPSIAVFQAGVLFSKMFERLFQAWVMAYRSPASAAIEWEDVKARPWEPQCAKCCKASDEGHLLMCDYCEAKCHTYCLTPPLPDVPIGLWLCPRCELLDLDRPNLPNLSCALEAAIRQKVTRGLEERKFASQRMYLVKWKDLGYSFCSWEKPSKIKDDMKIEEYHRLNDPPSADQKLPEEEASWVLSKSYEEWNPAVVMGDEVKQLEGQAYAQIRAAHFLQWNLEVPTEMRKDCGPLLHMSELTRNASRVRQEVALALTNIVDHCAKGLLPTAADTLQRTGEYDVTCYRHPGESLSLNIGNLQDDVVVMGFRETPQGGKGPLERSGRIRKDDMLVAVNGVSVSHMPFQDILRLLAEAEGWTHLRFVAMEHRDDYRKGKAPLETRGPVAEQGSLPWLPLLGCVPQPLQNAISPDPRTGTWTAQLRVDDRIEIIGNFKSKAEALTAFENAVSERYPSQDALAMSRDLQFSANGSVAVKDLIEDFESDTEGSSVQYTAQDIVDDWRLLGDAGKLVRAIKDSKRRPNVGELSGPFWFRSIDEDTLTMTGTSTKPKWIRQLDAVSCKLVKYHESTAAACRATLIPLESLMRSLDRGDLAGGFKWAYSHTADVQKAQRNWAFRFPRAEDSDEAQPWRRKLPTQIKEFKNGNKLRDYQLQGVQWLLRCWYEGRSCILADEMGLGKTVQIVTMLEHLYTVDRLPGPFLVVVPLSTIEHWRREFETWTDLRFCMYYDVGGGRGMRDVIRHYEWYYHRRPVQALKIHVLVTTYESLIRDCDEIAVIPWRCIIVDEAHRLRNWKGRLHECLKVVAQCGQEEFAFQHKILMTGTPLQNNTQELWSLLNFIEPTRFPDLERFADCFGKVETADQVALLQKRLEPHLLRRTKEDVASDIPGKDETIIDVELTMLQKQYYRAIFERNHGFLYNRAGVRGMMPKLMNIQMELRKCCNHPWLIEGAEEAAMERLQEEISDPARLEQARLVQGLIASSGKMVLMDKLLPKLQREGHKVLIFSQMLRVLDLLEEFCERRGYSVERLDGRVTGNQRQQSIDRFNKNAHSFVFLLSTRAGGIGINLTAADTVIIFDSDWNPQNDVQAQARCHRIGQTKEVSVYRLITRNSFEAELFDRASKKLALENAILGGQCFRDEIAHNGGEDAVDKPSNKEVEQLLRQGAYSLLEDDDVEAQDFCQEDIDKTLAERTHRVNLEGPKQGELRLSRRSAAQHKRKLTGSDSEPSVNVNDPDFWSKIMPDLKTPDALERRWQALEQEDPSSARDSAMTAFFQDLATMTAHLSDLQQRGKCPPREREAAVMLLVKLGVKGDLIGPSRSGQIERWKAQLEVSRKRDYSVGMYNVDGEEAADGGQRRRKKAPASDCMDICMICHNGDAKHELLDCAGICKRAFHLQCINLPAALPSWLCADCCNEQMWCLLCNQSGIMGKEVKKCKKSSCGRFYHQTCIEQNEFAEIISSSKGFTCPLHVCHICHQVHLPSRGRSQPFLQCVKCPVAYHARCAGGRHLDALTPRHMICDAHSSKGSGPFNPETPNYRFSERPRHVNSKTAAGRADEEGEEVAEDSDNSSRKKRARNSSGRRPNRGSQFPSTASKPGGPASDFVSNYVGPFRGEGWHIRFYTRREGVVPGSGCYCARDAGGGSGSHLLLCEQCDSYRHLGCAGVADEDVINGSIVPYCRVCQQDEKSYQPSLTITFERVREASMVASEGVNVPSQAALTAEGAVDLDGWEQLNSIAEESD